MTRLYIQGQEVVLPEGFSQTFTEENPFFTKNGQYSLEIELSLLHPQNAKIYKHCNRGNSVLTIPENRTATIIVDNRVFLQGTEAILSILDTTVKIQLLSGNSELNYLIGGDLKIRDLDLGAAVLNTNGIKSRLDQSYPAVDWQILPFANNDNTFIGNCFIYADFADGVYADYNDKLYYYGCYKPNTGMAEDWDQAKLYNQRPQPYLCAIIRMMLSALGYTLTLNQIAEDPLFKNFYVVHGSDTVHFAKMLPSWTVNEFFQEVENFFDCTLVIDSFEKTVQILFNYKNLEQAQRVELEVIDDYEDEIDEDNILTHQGANIGYALDSEDYYSINKLDSALKAIAIEISATMTNIRNYISNVADVNRFKKIFHDTDSGQDFIAWKDGAAVYPKRVDSFKNFIQNNEDQDSVDLEYKIIPASFRTFSLQTDVVFAGATRKNYYMQFPLVETYDPILFKRTTDDEVDFSLQTLIADSSSLKSTSTNSKLRLAIYDGRKVVDLVNGASSSKVEPYPLCFVEDNPEYRYEISRSFMAGNHPFRLDWLWSRIYSKMLPVDTTKSFKYTFFDKATFDIKSEFLIRNKTFLCKKIERTVDASGVNPISVGYFYPIN